MLDFLKNVLRRIFEEISGTTLKRFSMYKQMGFKKSSLILYKRTKFKWSPFNNNIVISVFSFLVLRYKSIILGTTISF